MRKTPRQPLVTQMRSGLRTMECTGRKEEVKETPVMVFVTGRKDNCIAIEWPCYLK